MGLNYSFNSTKIKKEKIIEEESTEEKTKTHKSGKRHITRKASSERVLEEVLPWQFEDGDCYHCISQGDVDSFSYFKHILKSNKFDYALISTWCAAAEDFKEIENYIDRGFLKKIDFYVGEIFEKSYPEAFERATRIVQKCGGRLCIFRNNSKVMVLKGDVSFVVESSANLNTNPRCENTVVTCDKKLAEFYIDFYKKIKNFKKETEVK